MKIEVTIGITVTDRDQRYSSPGFLNLRADYTIPDCDFVGAAKIQERFFHLAESFRIIKNPTGEERKRLP